MRVQSLGQEDPLEEETATHSISYLEKFYEQKNLAGYSPWGHQESDMTEHAGGYDIPDWQNSRATHSTRGCLCWIIFHISSGIFSIMQCCFNLNGSWVI